MVSAMNKIAMSFLSWKLEVAPQQLDSIIDFASSKANISKDLK